jgi:hypothetical protein
MNLDPARAVVISVIVGATVWMILALLIWRAFFI